MSHSNPLILRVHLAGAEPYQIGDEIWQQSLADAIRAEAETIADYVDPDLLPRSGQAGRVAVCDRVVVEMTAALRHAGDTYTAPDGIAWCRRLPVAMWTRSARSWRALTVRTVLSCGAWTSLRCVGSSWRCVHGWGDARRN
jgi:hypothetical protein